MVTLFVTHIRPILVYCSCVWNVGYSRDTSLIESVQRGWTKNFDRLQGLNYKERLKSLKLFLIKGWLLRSDLIKYWKIICCDVAGCDLTVLFQRSLEERTRGHRCRLVMPCCNTDVRKHFFNVHCIKVWNEFPGRIVEAGSFSTFKALLAEYLRDVLFDCWFCVVSMFVDNINCTEYHSKGCILDSH